MEAKIDHRERLKFLDIDESTRRALLEFQPILAKEIDGILDRFYDHVLQNADAAKVFKGKVRWTPLVGQETG